MSGLLAPLTMAALLVTPAARLGPRTSPCVMFDAAHLESAAVLADHRRAAEGAELYTAWRIALSTNLAASVVRRAGKNQNNNQLERPSCGKA